MTEQQAARRRRRNRKILAAVVLMGAVALCVGIVVGMVSLISRIREGISTSSDASSSAATTASTVATSTTATTTGTTQATTTTRPLTFTEDGHYIQEGTPDWNLILVNQWNWLDADYYQQLTDQYIKTFSSHGKMDSRVHQALQQMTDAAHQAGFTGLYGLYLFRTVERSESNWSKRVNSLLAQGYSREQAEKKAQSIQARGYTSEHNAGLAADMVCYGYEGLDQSFDQTPEFKWLKENCYKYGFILRYPKDKQDITGVIYEPWHYRYVGVEAATEIMARGICLEEYLAERGG